MPAFVCEALSLLTPQNADVLELSDSEVGDAAAMRKRAVEFLLRFVAPRSAADAGTAGFWPELQQDWHLGDRILERYFDKRFGGPRFFGYRAPLNLSFFPRNFAIASDADDTAAISVALLDANLLGEADIDLSEVPTFFADWRDLGNVPQRNQKPWISPSSGAYLTWLAYRDDTNEPTLNDVDVLVNANVLYALGRLGALDTAGVSESVELINGSVLSAYHLVDGDKFSLYYPDSLALHYFVIRAYVRGGLFELAPAAEALAAELRESVVVDTNDAVHWDRGDPHLNTAFAVLSLQIIEPENGLIRRGINYLIAQQDRRTGAWDAGVFFVGRMDGGDMVSWTSKAFTTAMAMQAIIRFRLHEASDATEVATAPRVISLIRPSLQPSRWRRRY